MVNLFALDINFTQKEDEYIKKHIPVTYVYDIDWKPFEWKNHINRHTGIIADILKLIEKKSGLKFEAIHTNSWATAVMLAQNHKVDMYSAIPFDKNRAKYMNFTQNDIFTYNACFVKRKDDARDIDTLKIKHIAIVKSSSLGRYIKSKYPNATYIEVDKTNDGFKVLREKHVDLFAINSATADFMINKKGFKDLKIAKKLDYTFHLKIAISKDMPKEVVSIIDKTLGSITQTQRDRIYDKWMEPIIIKTEVNWTIIAYIVVVLLLVVAFVLYKQSLMKKSLDEFTEVIDASMEGIFIFKDGVCIGTNKSALEILGYSDKSEIIGKNAFSFVDHSYHDIVKQHMKNHDVKPYEALLRKKDGTTIHTLLRGKELVNRKVRLSSFIDISELKEKESLLLQQSKLASMGEMIGNIAHQWRQPLSVISTSVTGMKIQKECGILEDQQFYDMCDHINDNVQYLSKTIDDFRNFIKNDKEKKEFKLKHSIENLLTLVRNNIKKYQINVVVNVDENITIYGYENELIQALMNIINNSKDVLVANNIENKLILIESKKEDDKIILCIKDNGLGIPDEVLPKIFDPYFTTKHQSQGTGLGLHMTYNIIVNSLNGSIKAYNTTYNYETIQYNGASFLITLNNKEKTK